MKFLRYFRQTFNTKSSVPFGQECILELANESKKVFKRIVSKTIFRSDTSANPYTVFTRRKDNKDLIQCPTPGCDGMGHSTGNYSTHRRQTNTENMFTSTYSRQSLVKLMPYQKTLNKALDMAFS